LKKPSKLAERIPNVLQASSEDPENGLDVRTETRPEHFIDRRPDRNMEDRKMESLLFLSISFSYFSVKHFSVKHFSVKHFSVKIIIWLI